MTDDVGKTKPSETARWLDPGQDNAQLVYILYFLGFLTGVTVIVGLVMAYINRGKSEPFVDSHYTWLIRTFWMGLLFSIISTFLMIIGIGFLLIIATAIWAIIRLVKGLQQLARREAVPEPASWWI